MLEGLYGSRVQHATRVVAVASQLCTVAILPPVNCDLCPLMPLMAVKTLFLITITILYKYLYTYCIRQPSSAHSHCLFSSPPSLLFLLWDAAVVSPPDLLVETLSLHLPTPSTLSCTYSTPYSVLAFTCYVRNCHQRHSFLFLFSTYPCNSNLRNKLHTH